MCRFCLLIRSIIFVFLMYAWMAILGILGAFPALLSKNWAYSILKLYCRSVFWLARTIVGLTYEIRGEIPTGSVVVASKHQSFYDILIHFYEMPRPNFIMKREIVWTPFIGWYALRIGATPVKRGGKGTTIKKMVSRVEGNTEENQLVVYPQGTRVAPDDHKPYKVGAAVLTERMGHPCVLAATNVGVFWPRKGIMRYPGTAVVEYLSVVPDGLTVEEMTQHMEAVIEPASDRLVDEGRQSLSLHQE